MPFDLPHSIEFADSAYQSYAYGGTAIYGASSIYEGLFILPSHGGAWHAEIPTATAEIEAYAAMEENWDGYGAVRISERTKLNALAALDVLVRVAPIPEITPNPNGTLSFEWETDEGRAHLEIGRTRFSFYIKPCVGAPILADGDADEITSDIGSLVANSLFPSPHSPDRTTSISLGTYVQLPY